MNSDSTISNACRRGGTVPPDESWQNAALRGLPLLALVCLAALLFHVYIEHSGDYITRVYLERYYAGYMARLMAEKPFWYFLLPMPDIKGVWATTGFVPIYFLETWIGPHATYLLLSTVATASFGVSLWLVFRRVLPAIVGAAALAFSPFNDSVFLWNGSNNVYMTIGLLAPAFGLFGAYILREGRRAQLVGGTVLLVLGALSYEVWLDLAAIVILAAPLVVLFARRAGNAELQRRYLAITVIVAVAAVIYTLIRAQTLRSTAIPGLEFQMIWDHASFGALFDDFAFNVVFLFYLAVSQLLPGFLGTSLAIFAAGRLDPAVLQHGYQPDLYPFVASHYLNLWLIYAGALFAAVVFATILILRKAIRERAPVWLAAGLIGLALLVGSPTHAVLKFVAFNGVPFYAYKATIGVMVVYLAVAAAVAWTPRRWRAAFVGALTVWLALVVFTRAAWVNENVLEIWGSPGFFANGFYPDPWLNLKKLLGAAP